MAVPPVRKDLSFILSSGSTPYTTTLKKTEPILNDERGQFYFTIYTLSIAKFQ